MPPLKATGGPPTEASRAAEVLRAADRAILNLTLYCGTLEGPIGRAYVDLVDALTPTTPGPASEEAPPSPSPAARPSRLYRRLFALLAREMEFADRPAVGDAWQNHLLERILSDENAFSLKAQDHPVDAVGETVQAAVSQDLGELRRLFDFAGEALLDAVLRREPDAACLLPLTGFLPSPRPRAPSGAEREDADLDLEMKQRFEAEPDWPRLLAPIAGYLRRRSLGPFREFKAFRWERQGGQGRLAGIAEPDPVHLDDLIGYDVERRLLIQNTEHFVAGLPANNVLLYGDRGTGKSSTVKGMLNAYSDRGLRMIEVQKEHLSDFPQILRLLRGRREPFVLFIDDLSFEEHETHYKDLKALLEGSLEARPSNVLLYATSNRRHLIKERFSDRIHPLADDEIHLNDTTEEKLSLSDRFGITLTFLAPTQERYLEIVRGMAARHGIVAPDAELSARALTWATQRGGRSGRVARQFMDHLIAEQGAASMTGQGRE